MWLKPVVSLSLLIRSLGEAILRRSEREFRENELPSASADGLERKQNNIWASAPLKSGVVNELG